MLAAGSAWVDPWGTGAAFGMAAALASWAGARIAGNLTQSADSASAAPPQDHALHDAFTLALIVAVSAGLGLSAALLLPAAGVLALAIRRMARRRAAGEKDTMLLLLAALAMTGLCEPLGFQDCATACIALAVLAMIKAGHRRLRLPRLRMWHVWGASALMCAGIAATGHGPAAWPAFPLGMTVLAGAIYGAAAGASSRMLSGANAKALAAAVPFLSVAAGTAMAGSAHLPQIAAAAVLLAAAAVTGSRRLPAPPRKPAVSSPNGWPMGWV